MQIQIIKTNYLSLTTIARQLSKQIVWRANSKQFVKKHDFIQIARFNLNQIAWVKSKHDFIEIKLQFESMPGIKFWIFGGMRVCAHEFICFWNQFQRKGNSLIWYLWHDIQFLIYYNLFCDMTCIYIRSQIILDLWHNMGFQVVYYKLSGLYVTVYQNISGLWFI